MYAFIVADLRLQQCQFPQETLGKGLDQSLNRLISFSLLKDGPAKYKFSNSISL